MARPASGHMPFKGHRTCAEVIEDKNRLAILRSLGCKRRSASVPAGSVPQRAAGSRAMMSSASTGGRRE